MDDLNEKSLSPEEKETSETNSEETNSEETNSEFNSEFNSEESNEETNEETSGEKVNKVGNIYQFINRIRNFNWIYYRTIENCIKNNRLIRYLLIFQFYILFGTCVYYSSKKTSLLMSPYLMNNGLYKRIYGFREIQDIAMN